MPQSLHIEQKQYNVGQFNMLVAQGYAPLLTGNVKKMAECNPGTYYIIPPGTLASWVGGIKHVLVLEKINP